MAHWKARVEFLLSVIGLLFLSPMVEALQGKTCQNSLLSGGVGHLEPRFQGEGVVPLPIYWHHSKGNWLRYKFATGSFYIMKVCSRLFILYCRNWPKGDKFRYFIPILRQLGAVYNLVWWLVGSPCRVLVKCNWTSFSSSYGWGSSPCQYIDTTRKAIDCATTMLPTFLCNETLQQTFRPLLSKLSKRRQI